MSLLHTELGNVHEREVGSMLVFDETALREDRGLPINEQPTVSEEDLLADVIQHRRQELLAQKEALLKELTTNPDH